MNKLNLIAYFTIVKTEAKRVLRIAPQTILPSVITTTLYYLIFGSIIGSRVGEMHGVPYMVYIAPGLIIMNIITNSYANVAMTFYQARFMGHIEEMLVSPMKGYTMLAGYVTGGVIRGIVIAFFVSAVSIFFTNISIYSYPLTLLVAILTSVLLSLFGFLNAMFARSFDDTSIVTTFILTPLSYLGGIFFSIDVLPDFWGKIALFNPILYLVDSFRYAVTGITDINPYLSIAIISILCLVMFTINSILLQRGKGIRN